VTAIIGIVGASREPQQIAYSEHFALSYSSSVSSVSSVVQF